MSRFSEILTPYQFEPINDVILAEIEHRLKRECPGHYQVRFNSHTNTIEVVFFSEKDLTYFNLKMM